MIQTNCPSCGAPLTFQSSTSLLAVCNYCRSTIIRQDVNLEILGKVSEVRESHTPLQLGATGNFQGTGFKVIGRVQVRWDGGLWNEWYVMTADGRGAWLAEANGQLTMLFPEEQPSAIVAKLPSWEGSSVGDDVQLSSGSFKIVERRKARVVGAEGELPFAVGDGYALPYADCRSEGNRFATLDYAGDGVQVYAGPMVKLQELKMKGLRALVGWGAKGVETGGVPADIDVQRLDCPSCGNTVPLTVAGQTVRVGCESCGSILSPEDDRLKLVERYNKAMGKTDLRVGQRGNLGGTEFEIIGIVRRSVTEDGIVYPWHEYLLFNPYEGYRWLVENMGHWNFVEPCMGLPTPTGFDQMRLKQTTFRFFQGGVARVEHVVGELYWKVERGQTTSTADFIAPPYMLSREGDNEEAVWSIGAYVEKDDVAAAFGVDSLPRTQGVAPNEPFDPSGKVKKIYQSFAILAALLILATVGHVIVSGNHLVASVSGTVSADPASDTLYSQPFEVRSGRGALQAHATATLNNQWIYLDMALINEASGEIILFDKELEYYSGSGWSEGSRQGTRVVGPVSKGTWVLKVSPLGDTTKPGSVIQYTVTAHHDVPRFFPGLIALIMLSIVPIFAKLYQSSFENRRWNP